MRRCNDANAFTVGATTGLPTMLNGREKVADCSDAVRQLGMAKHKRLNFGFGPALPDDSVRATAHEHNIREIPLAGGALGCALWDGGAVLSRWIYANGGVFSGARVLELGCGVGLAGILAAHWAEHVTLSDYILQAVKNAEYNVGLNSHDAELDGEEDGVEVNGGPYRYAIADRVDAVVMDWDRELRDDRSAGSTDAAEWPVCSRAGTSAFHVQEWRHCRTCWDDPSSGCCVACAELCHSGHDLAQVEATRFRCDCADGCVAQPKPNIAPVDVIIGAELTYNLLSCASLAHVVDKYLKPDGVFYEVLSNDRDGVTVFREEIEKRGFTTVRHDAPAHFVGQFGTRKWSRQDDETYSLYTWRRASASAASKARFPDMA